VLAIEKEEVEQVWAEASEKKETKFLSKRAEPNNN